MVGSLGDLASQNVVSVILDQQLGGLCMDVWMYVWMIGVAASTDFSCYAAA